MDQLIDKIAVIIEMALVIVGAASLILAGLRKIANITPTTTDDIWVSKAEAFIAGAVKFLDRLAMNPDKTAAREPKNPGDAG